MVTLYDGSDLNVSFKPPLIFQQISWFFFGVSNITDCISRDSQKVYQSQKSKEKKQFYVTHVIFIRSR